MIKEQSNRTNECNNRWAVLLKLMCRPACSKREYQPNKRRALREIERERERKTKRIMLKSE